MAVTAERVTVATAAVALNPGGTSGGKLHITNGAATVDLGGPAVTSGAGYELASGLGITVELEPGELLYAVCASTSDVQVLRT